MGFVQDAGNSVVADRYQAHSDSPLIDSKLVMIALCLAALLTLAPAANTATVPATSSFLAQGPDQLPYQELTDQFRSDNGIAGIPAKSVEIEPVLKKNFFSTRIGIYEVWIPNASLKEKDTQKDFKGVCSALVESQVRWLNWLGEKAIDGEAVHADLASLSAWIKGWSLASLGQRDQDAPCTALEHFNASEEVMAISRRLTQQMRSGSILGTELNTDVPPVRLILMPERKQFVEFLAFTGWWKPELRSNFWVRGIQNWTEFRINDLQVIALQHPPMAETPGRYDGSSSMKANDNSGLEQQVVQLGTNQLLAYMHGQALPSPVLRGLSVQMLIEMYGSCHTRNDGDTRGRVTNARSVFIAGGASSGGTLGKNVAENRWRIDYGKHHYRRILKAVQKAGKAADKRNKHKYRYFKINSNSEGDSFVISAPIFRPIPGAAPVPPGFEGDQAEFTRAYYVSFMEWLQTSAGGAKKDSQIKFAEVLSRMNANDKDSEFGEILEEVYGIPMVNEKLDTDCIEGLFIKWIAKG